MKILIDSSIPFVEGVFEPYVDVVYADGAKISREDVSDADAMVIRTRTVCDKELLEGSAVKLIATVTAGTNNIDKEYCRSRGISVKNAAGANSDGVLQYVFSALYGVAARKTIKLDDATIGIVGVGETGRKIEDAARKLGFSVLLYDPLRAKEVGPEKFCSLEYLARNSQVITLHIPVNASTANLADEAFFSHVNPGTIFINAADGALVDEDALIDASIKLGAVIIDTWRNEPFVNKRLMDIADIATPHIAGYSLWSKRKGSTLAVRTVAEFFGIQELKLFDTVLDEELPGPLKLDLEGLSQGERASVLQYNYPVFTADFMFSMAPASFESLRAGYRYRREIII